MRANSNERMSMITGSRCAPRLLPPPRRPKSPWPAGLHPAARWR
ncbi:hypothetical protein C7S13_1737 [Burkholderia cepacia]|nr:hypothetical protein [Burkholderia cepacia]